VYASFILILFKEHFFYEPFKQCFSDFTWVLEGSGRSTFRCLISGKCGVMLLGAASTSSTLLQSKDMHQIYLPLLYNRIWLRMELWCWWKKWTI